MANTQKRPRDKAPGDSAQTAFVSNDRLTAQARLERLADILRRARYAVLPGLCLAAIVVPVSWWGPDRTAVLEYSAILLALTGAITIAAWRFDAAAASSHDVRTALRLAPVLGLAIGACSGLIAFRLLHVSGDVHHIVVMLATAGAMSLAPLLGPMLSVCLLYLAAIVAGTGLAVAGGASIATSALLGYGCVVGAACLAFHGGSLGRAVERLRAGEREDVIDLLLRGDVEAPDAWFWQTDASLRLRDVSDRLAAAAGVAVTRLEGKLFVNLFTCRTATMVQSTSVNALLANMAAHQPFQGEDVESRTAEGASTWWRLTGKPVLDRRGGFAGYRGVGWNVSARRETASRIAHLSNHDALTGLDSRERFQMIAARECRMAATDGRSRALLVFNIQGFKQINNSIGHAAGDELLKAVATRIRSGAPRSATVARLGGDEFAVFYCPPHPSSAEDQARSLGTALRAPFDVNGGQLSVDISAGIAIAPEHASEADTLVRKADLALIRAKAQSRGRHQVFRPEFEHEITAQRELEADVKLALARGEFTLHYQPLLDLVSGRIVSFEALIRWVSPTRGNVSPANFIPAAEKGALIIAVGRFVLSRACADAATWQENARVAVNISPQHLRSPEFLTDVALALQTSGLPAARLEIEITEGVFLENAAQAVENLHALRASGIKIALDDFGTGFSSLNYLTNFPVDKIKIDQTFIRDFVDRHENRAIVDAILTLARKLGVRVTAEGVETAEQALMLKLRRCDDIQGYLVSKPRPAAEVNGLFAAAPEALRAAVPALFENSLAAVVAMRRKTAA